VVVGGVDGGWWVVVVLMVFPSNTHQHHQRHQVEAGVEPLAERRRFLTARTYSKLLRSDTNAGRLVRNHTVFRKIIGG
jgi:hypothetical protein